MQSEHLAVDSALQGSCKELLMKQNGSKSQRSERGFEFSRMFRLSGPREAILDRTTGLFET